MTRILFAARSEAWQEYRAPLARALEDAGLAAEVVTEASPETVDYIVYAPNSRLRDFGPFTGLKAVLNLWAGVEDVAPNPTLTVPLARMVDPGLTEGMVEWCLGHALRHHLGTDLDVLRMPGDWSPRVPPLARDRKVAVLGLGELGGAVARALASLGFDVSGWSRRPRRIDGVRTFGGADGMETALQGAEIVVLLLPLTPETESIFGDRAIERVAPGAVLLNPGRGALIDDAALLAALDAGRLSHATLDVFREEPLPEPHPFWRHPGVTVTPHIASATRPDSASRVIAENVRRGEAGEPLLHLVDREAGY